MATSKGISIAYSLACRIADALSDVSSSLPEDNRFATISLLNAVVSSSTKNERRSLISCALTPILSISGFNSIHSFFS